MTNTIFSIDAAEHYVKVPDDFPRPEIAGAVAVFQSKLTMVEHEGKYYMPSGTPPELDAPLEICEDISQQLVVKSIARWQYSSLPPHRRMGGSGHGHHAGGTHMKTKFLKCTGCGRIHFGITEAAAADEVRSFNEYLARLSPADRQSSYGGRMASIERYKKCPSCGALSETFIPAVDFENSGVTMQSVIAPNVA